MSVLSSFRAKLIFAVTVLGLLSFAANSQSIALQDLIDKAAAGSEVIFPAGRVSDALVIKNGITLRGESPDRCIIDVTSDEPAITVAGKDPVVIENITIRWKRVTSGASKNPQAALFLRDASLTLRSVRIEAPDGKMRCPSAITALGFSDLRIEQSHLEGFDFTVQASEGAKARISKSVVFHSGHCAVTAGPDSNVTISDCIIAGSEAHGIRCTGGFFEAKGNMVIANKNRGFYLGNKAAKGSIQNNVIQDNGTGISGFGGSEVEITNNLISGSDYAGIDMRDSCHLTIAKNILINNTRGLVLFKESGRNKNIIGSNTLGGNKTATENFEEAPSIVQISDNLSGPSSGNFTISEASGHGLQDAAPFNKLWIDWTAMQTARTRPVASP